MRIYIAQRHGSSVPHRFTAYDGTFEQKTFASRDYPTLAALLEMETIPQQNGMGHHEPVRVRHIIVG
jgi:hypothetical protein